MKKKVKARKEHQCGQCERIIQIGEVYWFIKSREPVYGETSDYRVENQIGIRYVEKWHCLDEDKCFERYLRWKYLR